MKSLDWLLFHGALSPFYATFLWGIAPAFFLALGPAIWCGMCLAERLEERENDDKTH